jgi:CCR4-NOT transcription complex subunit 7/8
MDTEFPGVVARPIGNFKTSSDYHYQTMRCNVDLLKIIQIGLTLTDENGKLATTSTPTEQDAGCTWQFNFRFSVNEDMYAPDSIELLAKSGIDFQRHEEIGIIPQDFAELLITSGLVLNEDVKWISFHSGYDFGYLLKLLTTTPLPAVETEFFDLLNLWFPNIFDIKYIIRSSKVLNHKGGLQDVADELRVARIGTSHQAGSDSLLTAATFFKLKESYFSTGFDEPAYKGHLYGLGPTSNIAVNGSVNATQLAPTSAEKPASHIPTPPLQPPLPPHHQASLSQQQMTQQMTYTPGMHYVRSGVVAGGVER